VVVQMIFVTVFVVQGDVAHLAVEDLAGRWFDTCNSKRAG
jgi:hypothetical protein